MHGAKVKYVILLSSKQLKKSKRSQVFTAMKI